MSFSELRLRFEGDRDGTGELVAFAKSGSFSGEGGAYFGITDVQDFANALRAFPLPKDTRPSLSGGFAESNEPGETEHLGITVYALDERGHIGVQVRLAMELWDGIRIESQCAAQLEVVTTYAPLAEFGEKLSALLRGDIDEAVLPGEVFTE